jgi:chemotaxis receptor (MCP) glutamine deamidase CheD
MDPTDSSKVPGRREGAGEREFYAMPGPNQISFIGTGQTLYLVLGSCISSVLIGRKDDRFVMAANHIMIAREHRSTIIDMKSARSLVDDMLHTFQNEYGIDAGGIICLHLVGAGSRISDDSFRVHRDNILETKQVLGDAGIPILFEDTGSHFFATYSLRDRMVSVFVENRFIGSHLSYILDMERLFELGSGSSTHLPASGLLPGNRGFEDLVENGVIVFITGEKNRSGI